MKRRYIVLGSGRRVSLGAYVKAWRQVLAVAPDTTIKGDLRGDWGPVPASRVLRQFREGLHDRINRHIPAYGVGRRWDSDHWRDMRQSANRINHPRLILDQLPRWLPAQVADHLRPRLRGEA